MNKVILFARVSTQQQSLESQIQELRNEGERQGYKKSQQLVIQMKESAVTLDTEERQGIRMLKDAIEADSSIKAVVIYEISRLSRRPKVLYEMRDWLIERKVNLICIKPYMVLLDKDGTMSQTASILFSLFGSMAESEGYIRKERMARGKKAKKAAGGYIGGTPLWGYKVNESGYVVPDKTLVPIVNKIYEMYIDGGSFRTIGQWMMKQGLHTGNLNSATKQAGSIISHSEYAGIYKDSYPYEAIISKELYEKARLVRADRHKIHKRVKKTALCKGVLYSKSGYALSPNIAKKQYKLYQIDHTENMTINFNIIDDFLWEKTTAQAHKHRKDGAKKRLEELKRGTRERQATISRYLELIKKTKEQIKRVERRIIEGKMEEMRGDQMLNELNDKLTEYEKTYGDFTMEHIYSNVEIKMLNQGVTRTDYSNMTDEERNALVKQYIDKVIFEKTMIKRGHYYMTIIYKYGGQEEYYLWSSGPWHNIEKKC